MPLSDYEFNEATGEVRLRGSHCWYSSLEELEFKRKNLPLRPGCYLFKDKDESRKYRLELVIKVPLWFVAEDLYRSEGADDSIEFQNVWKEIHPRNLFMPFDEVWYHHFTETGR